jgi:quercetin dioxygenase-like cupin family protein
MTESRLRMLVVLAPALVLAAGAAPAQDRALAVPGMKVLLENARVRVQYHDVAVGETVPMHSHPAYVACVLAPYKARLRQADGSERVVDRKPGDVFWGEPVTHTVENLGEVPIHNLIVELKDAASPTAADCAWPAGLDAVAAAPGNHRVALENDRVRVLDVTVAPGEREAVHAHCRPSVMYVMQEGVYRDYDAEGRLIEDVKSAPPPASLPMTLWLEPQAPHAVHNLDARAVRLLRVELKAPSATSPARP